MTVAVLRGRCGGSTVVALADSAVVIGVGSDRGDVFFCMPTLKNAPSGTFITVVWEEGFVYVVSTAPGVSIVPTISSVEVVTWCPIVRLVIAKV
ncbi:MAG TPA: hypothetical protein VHT23_11695 [Gemmatimonadaceae bacterium]|nr:hypothetical protein [Gemmatimonadaceae bacterium]